MQKPVAIIVSKRQEERKEIEDLLRDQISKQIGIDFAIRTYEDKDRVKKLGNLHIATSLDLDPPQENPGIKIEDENNNCAKLLFTSDSDLRIQYDSFREKSLIYKYKVSRELNSDDINWEDFRGWFRSNYPAFDEIVIEKNKDKTRMGIETKQIIEYLRKRKKIFQPISIGIVGLGILGRGILENASKEKSISDIYVSSNFVNGEYGPLLDRLEQKDKIRGGSLDALFDANPDVLIISTGKHNVNYNRYKTREELTEMLLKTGIEKINPILDKITKRRFQGLIVIQSNPNGHLIRYMARKGKINFERLTSFPPDTLRHKIALYSELKIKNPGIREEDIELIAIGEHMKGGTPLYDECTVKGQPLFDLFPKFKNKRLKEKISDKARKKGLQVMQSTFNIKGDYRGVPDLVTTCLQEIAYFQKRPKYPAYYMNISVPIEYTYHGAGNEVNIRTKRIIYQISELTKNKKIIEELYYDIGDLKKQLKPYLNQKR